ncbi:MAG TPA: tetratricopeptide repeat protein [Steroidobacteraceae bacterium]|nr:tetratricopeptide repeat protein [Steroidobacteraceae bacterium]
MLQRCDNDHAPVGLKPVGLKPGVLRRSIAVLCLAALGACSSSPSKDESSPASTAKAQPAPKQTESKAVSKQGEVEAPIAEVVPTGPPPVPAEATAQFEKALTLLGAGDYAPAAQEFQRLSTAYPNYSGPLTNLGIVYLKTGKLADAEKTLQAATKRGEPNATTYNQLGIVYRKLGRFKEADDAYSQASRIDPNYALAHLNLGVLCDMYLQQPQRALGEFERYLQLTSNPDQRVSGWVKELKGRVGSAKPADSAPKESSAPAGGAAQ